MSNDTEINEFSKYVTKTAMNAVKSFVSNFTSTDSSMVTNNISSVEQGITLEGLTSETSTLANVVANTSDNLVATGIQKIITTISTTTSLSAGHVPDDSLTESSSYPLNPLAVTHTPISAMLTTYAVSHSSDMGSDITTDAAPIHFDIQNENDQASAHESMQNHIKNLNSPRSIQYLIQVSTKQSNPVIYFLECFLKFYTAIRILYYFK